MIRDIELATMLFLSDDPQEDKRSKLALLHAVECLCRINQGILQVYTDTPRLYNSGVYYAEPGKKRWQDILTTLKRGKGDCKDLAAWRVAELRMQGIRCRPFLKWRDGSNMFHVQVYFDGTKTIEDPSYKLGMARGNFA